MNGEIVTFLRESVALFSEFGDQELEQLVAGSRLTSFEPNEAVIEFGEEGRFLGILIDGEAEVSIADESGRRHRLNLLHAGDLFGEMSLMTGERTTADVIGVTRCRALLVPQPLFSSRLVTHPAAIKTLSKTLSARARVAGSEEKSRELAAAALRHSSDPYGFHLHTDEPAVILVVNCGSSSLKYNLFHTNDETANVRGVIERIGNPDGIHLAQRIANRTLTRDLPAGSHSDAFAAMIDALITPGQGALSSLEQIKAVGHRVVHGGERFDDTVVINDTVVSEIDRFSVLAPLHNPVNLLGIREARARIPRAVHVAVFDTAFHHTLPPYAYLYGLPWEYYEKKRVRRYGFHGMSHLYVSLKAAQVLKKSFNELEIVTCHLGNGASMCAVDHGRSVDTSMGLTPAEGLIMGTRCGDIDPGTLTHIMRSEGLDAAALDVLINKKSGLAGLSGVSNDMREIERAAESGDHRALLALKAFSYRVRKYIGAYGAAMGGIDVIIFTGGIGENSPGVRSLACQGLGFMGIVLDEEKNRMAAGGDAPADISTPDSAIRVLVIPTNEELMIARETLRALGRHDIAAIIKTVKSAPIPLEVSAHHVHLAQEHVEQLFGAGHTLAPESPLSQPGQFACREKVTLIGPRGNVERVRVLGPARSQSQIEIAMTEQFRLGINPPIRESGDIENTPGITLAGTAGSATLDKGVICAMRHIHMTPEDALRLGMRDRYMVRVRVEGDRELTFGDVLVRVHPDFQLAMHIDTDEANAANIRTGAIGHIDGIQSRN